MPPERTNSTYWYFVLLAINQALMTVLRAEAIGEARSPRNRRVLSQRLIRVAMQKTGLAYTLVT